jgi:uncharacterized protein involved in copper resistance
MKKQFLTCFAALSIAAIATSATNPNSTQQHYAISKTVYDTTPGNHNKNNMDSSASWKKNKKNHTKNKSGDSTMRNMDSVANPPR